MPLNKVFLRPPKLVLTKTLLLKHYYRRHGISKKTHKQKFSRDCPGNYPGTVPALFLRFPGNFVYVFPFFPRKKEKKNTHTHT